MSLSQNKSFNESVKVATTVLSLTPIADERRVNGNATFNQQQASNLSKLVSTDNTTTKFKSEQDSFISTNNRAETASYEKKGVSVCRASKNLLRSLILSFAFMQEKELSDPAELHHVVGQLVDKISDRAEVSTCDMMCNSKESMKQADVALKTADGYGSGPRAPSIVRDPNVHKIGAVGSDNKCADRQNGGPGYYQHNPILRDQAVASKNANLVSTDSVSNKFDSNNRNATERSGDFTSYQYDRSLQEQSFGSKATNIVSTGSVKIEDGSDDKHSRKRNGEFVSNQQNPRPQDHAVCSRTTNVVSTDSVSNQNDSLQGKPMIGSNTQPIDSLSYKKTSVAPCSAGTDNNSNGVIYESRGNQRVGCKFRHSKVLLKEADELLTKPNGSLNSQAWSFPAKNTIKGSVAANPNLIYTCKADAQPHAGHNIMNGTTPLSIAFPRETSQNQAAGSNVFQSTASLQQVEELLKSKGQGFEFSKFFNSSAVSVQDVKFGSSDSNGETEIEIVAKIRLPSHATFSSTSWAPRTLDPKDANIDPQVFHSESGQQIPFPGAAVCGQKTFDYERMFASQINPRIQLGPQNPPSSSVENARSKLPSALGAGVTPVSDKRESPPESVGATAADALKADAADALKQLMFSGNTPHNNGSGDGNSPSNDEKGSKRKRKRPNYEPEVKKYVIPTMHDVLLGRGGRTNHHRGNHRYLQTKEEIQPRYMKASKDQKTRISQELVDSVYNWGGRFLKLDTACDKWYEVPNIVARKKASQTLREINTPEERAAKRARYQSKNGSTGSTSDAHSIGF